MLRRTGFKQPVRAERQPLAWPGAQHFNPQAVFARAAPVRPKQVLVSSKAHRQAVAALPCFKCGIVGYSQAAHADEGKGTGMKTCDLTCYPLCCTRPGITGCHYDVGTAGVFNREERRAFEKVAALDTTAKLAIKLGVKK